MFVLVLLWSGIYLGSCTGTQVRKCFSQVVLAWETFRNVTLIAPQVASEVSNVLMVRRWTPSGLPLAHPHPVWVVEMGGMSMSLVSVGDRLSPTRKKMLWCKVSKLHLEQRGVPRVERERWSLFFSFTDGS